MGERAITTLFVVRHGETLWNRDGRQQGQLDGELSPLGVRQAEALARGLAAERLDALYSSGLGRAVQTADVIGRELGLQVRTDARLRERHLGMLQGMTMSDFEREHPDEFARFRSDDADYVVPGGESVRQRHERHVAAATELARRHAGGRVAVVAHGGVLNSLIRHTLGLPMAGPRRYSLYNASINVFSVAQAEWRLLRWGDTHHLEGLDTLDDR
jgi:probable phosphoglycerate mutase